MSTEEAGSGELSAEQTAWARAVADHISDLQAEGKTSEITAYRDKKMKLWATEFGNSLGTLTLTDAKRVSR